MPNSRDNQLCPFGLNLLHNIDHITLDTILSCTEFLGYVFCQICIIYCYFLPGVFAVSSAWEAEMSLTIIKRTIWLLIVGPGIVGNIFVFVNYFCTFFWSTRKKFIHLILLHLISINIMRLFCKVLPKTIAIFGWSNFLDDAVCQIVAYLDRVARGLSTCTTSLLTVVQAIIMSPRSSRWARFKPRSAWHLLPFIFCFWILSCLISMKLLSYIRNVSSLNKSIINDNDSYCDFITDSQITKWMFLTFMALRDGLFQSLMAWASVYILYLLHKHHQQALQLRNSRLISQMPPEIRAAQSVLFLMCCFQFFHWSEFILTLTFSSEFRDLNVALTIIDIFSIGYSTVSPFVLIHRDGQQVRFWHSKNQPERDSVMS